MTLLTAIAIIGALFFAVLAAIMQAASACTALIPPPRVHRLVDNARPGALALQALGAQRSRVRGVAALTAGLSYASSAVAAFDLFETWFPALPGWLAAGIGGTISSLLVFSVVQVLPRTFAIANAEPLALQFAGPALVATRALSGVARGLGAPWKWALSMVRGEEIPSPWSTGDEYFNSAASDEEQVRERTEEALLEAVSDFGEKVVREVMVPRTDMAALEDTASVADAVEMIRATGYSRLPVFHDTIDDVQGVLYAKDLLTSLERGGDIRIARIARKPFFVPETLAIDKLLAELRSARTHLAIAADEYGGTSGLVTIEDILEEIVGEIFDEYDLEVPMLEELGNGRVRVDARLPLDDLNERFGTAIEIEGTDTVGGLFTTLAGRIPERGDSVEAEGLKLTADDLAGTRILHVTVEPAALPAEKGSDDA